VNRRALSSDPPETSLVDSVSHAWRALRHRNFRLFFFGQSISLIGTWMTRLATSWLVYRMTHSALLLGVVSFSGQIVSFLLGPFAGVWVERLNRRQLLVWTQAAAAVQSLALAALTLGYVVNLWEIIALSSFQGLINAFDMPGRQSFLVHMVEDRDDLSNAIAINSSMANGARLIGPAIAGIVIAVFGEGWCFLLDGFSYFAVIASLLMMRVQTVEIRRSASSMLEQMREGWNYVRTFRPIRTILLMFALLSLMGWPYSVLLPVFAGQVLHGGAHTLGWLTGASGVGALISGLSLAVRKSVIGLTRMLQIAGAMLGCALILFGLSHTLWLSLADGLRGIRLNAGRGGQQHGHPVAREGRQTSAGDELLHDGLFRVGAVRQPAGGRDGAPDRSAAYGDGDGRMLRGRFALVHVRAAEGPGNYAADLPVDGPAASQRS
jgi:MFS family permease